MSTQNTQVLTVSPREKMKLPSAKEFEASLQKAQQWASSVSYEEKDVDDMIQSGRRKKRV